MKRLNLEALENKSSLRSSKLVSNQNSKPISKESTFKAGQHQTIPSNDYYMVNNIFNSTE